MATTAIAEITNPAQLVSVLSGFKPFKAKRITLTGGSAGGTGTTAWASGSGVSFAASLLGWSKIDDVIIESHWVNAGKTLGLQASAEIPSGGATAKIHSFGSNGAAGAALAALTSDAYTCQLIVLGS